MSRKLSYKKYLKIPCKILQEKLRNQVRQNRKMLISAFAYVLSTNAKKLFLKERLGTKLYPHAVLGFS